MYTIALDPENFMTYKKPLYTISGFSIISPRRSKECVTPPLTAGFITIYGDGGSRTHVQKRRYFSVYERSPANLNSLIVVPAGGPSES